VRRPALAPVAPRPDDPLARARQLYNQRNSTPPCSSRAGAADAGARRRADLVAARAYLERYREERRRDDLATRATAAALDPREVRPRERAEYVVGSARRCSSTALRRRGDGVSTRCTEPRCLAGDAR
jgi:hypothetical protein